MVYKKRPGIIDDSDTKWWHIIALLIIIVFIASPKINTPVDTITEANIKAELKNEMMALEKIPGGSYSPISIDSKDYMICWVRVKFTSDYDFPTIVMHYDKQLKDAGWIEGSKRLRLWGNDKYVGYKKGKYAAEIGNPSKNEYFIEFSWDNSR